MVWKSGGGTIYCPLATTTQTVVGLLQNAECTPCQLTPNLLWKRSKTKQRVQLKYLRMERNNMLYHNISGPW